MELIRLLAAICLVLAVWHFVAYPAAIRLLAALRPAVRPQLQDHELPSVALIIAAFNEERVIGAKLANCLALDYPRDKLQIVVAADGSSDRTAERVRAVADPRVVCLHQPQRQGKGPALNRAVAAVTAEILVLSDANNDYSPDALRQLVPWLADPRVGGVTGAKRIQSSAERAASGGDGLYWRYESMIKSAESAAGGTVTGDGEIFALRRADYSPIPVGIINDDMDISLRLARRGLRIVYEPRATATEEGSITLAEDYQTKVRMIAGGFQNLRTQAAAAFGNGWFSVKFISHKVLRWLMPWILLGLLSCSLLLRDDAVFRWLLAGQLLVYGLALVGALGQRSGLRHWLVYVPWYFVLMNAAAAAALLRHLRGRQTSLWAKAAR
jgi:cellulose synthase/poly-beta-1,6-N-acetylglucosamine synthase-like glycosyltransferase